VLLPHTAKSAMSSGAKKTSTAGKAAPATKTTPATKATPASKAAPAGKKPAGKAAPMKGSAKVKAKKDWKSQHKHLFDKDGRDFRIGRDIQPKRDLSRFVKWPRYVRLQRQRAILKKRLKVPPAIHHLSKTLEKNQASNVFKLLAHYRPESPEDKKKRLADKAQAESKGQGADESKKPKFIKYGINHIANLVESKRAKLVVIAHDVDPVELVVWLPALCRKLEVPYVIVKGKARLGYLVHKKTATAVAVTDVRKEHQALLDQVIETAKTLYNDAVTDRRKWGGGVLGIKAQHVIDKRAKAIAKEQVKRV
jgi:large subunit ribosomal protein L7Ae